MLPFNLHTIKENKNSLANGFLLSYFKYPDRKAVFINERYYTYKELMDIVYVCYLKIAKQEIKFDQIGIYCSDNIHTYASILAISLYGAAYVPLNPKFPILKNKQIVDDTNLELILYSEQGEYLNYFSEKKLIDVTKNEYAFYDNSILLNLKKTNQPLAYILFTSGSSGQPKGVPVPITCVNHYFEVILKSGIYEFNENDRFIQMYDLTFDASVRWVFIPLIVGGCVYIVPKKGIHYINMMNLLSIKSITVAMMVPSVLHYLKSYFDEISLPALRYSFFGGEALPSDLVLSWAKCVPNAIIENFYGPTEATMSCTRYRWDKINSNTESENGIVPIGILNPGMGAIVLNEFLKPVEENEAGELCVYGPQVINNYLNNTHSDSFIKIKNKNGESVNCYKTGDIVRINNNNNLIFLGRKDNQVKIDGFRVELQEIENCVRNLTNGLLNVAYVNENKNGTKSIYVVIENYSNETADLLNSIKSMLPAYMVPKKIISIAKIPLNQNGKVDRLTLTKIW